MESELMPLPGDVIQIDPAHDTTFGACFAIVEETKKWGCKCYFEVPGKDGVAYYRIEHGQYKLIGVSEWRRGRDDEAEG